MRRVWAVLRREYLQRVRSRWFFFATLGVPLLLVASVAVPMWLSSRNEAAGRSIALIDLSGDVGDGVARALGEGGYTVERLGPDEEAEARRRVEEGEVGSYLVVDRESLSAGRAKLVSKESPSSLRQLGIRQAIIQASLERQLAGTGTDVKRVLAGGALDVESLEGSEGGMSNPAFAFAYLGSFVLYMVILIYAVAVMRSVLEEKTSRIVEVIISSLQPWQLMLGKILGVGAVGLTQMAVWALGGFLLGRTGIGIPALVARRPELAQLATLLERLPPPRFFGLFLVFFVSGYFIFSALYAAVGAMCNSEEEAQQAQFPVMLLLIVPIVALVSVIEDPSAPTSVALSFVPFFTPFLMFARAAGGAAPTWQIWLSVAGMWATVLVVAWVAGRIYRVGILMTGKRPSLLELVRWLREG